ncbi:MAG: hypothetical protein ACE5HY_02430 [Candidatus Hydrothermarchaeales archaeon]
MSIQRYTISKMKLKRTFAGVYFIEIPEDLIRFTTWKEGDEVEVLSGTTVSVRKGDLLLRKAD